MAPLARLPRNFAAVLTFSRPPMVFGAFLCALWAMFTGYPLAYLTGVFLLVLATVFDWIDGWFAERYIPNSRLGPLVDRMMDRLVITIIFPVLTAGMFWRLARLDVSAAETRIHTLHALLILGITVIVLMRDQVAHFLRNFATKSGWEVESWELTRLRTMVASPMAALLYAYAFYLPQSQWPWVSQALYWIDHMPIRVWFVLEILFLAINIISITLYLRKYGMLALDDICEDNEVLRRQILAVFPNAISMLNGTMGATAMVFAGYGRVKEAMFTLIAAAFFDRLDGAMARKLGLTEPLPDNPPRYGITLGAFLDDVSDLVSFCIAPAVIYFIVVSEHVQEPWVLWVGVIYLVGGIARLAYFTLDKKPIPGFFKGMPVPAAALMVMGPVEMVASYAEEGLAHLPIVLWVATAGMIMGTFVMNAYFIRYLHIGRLLGRSPAVMWVVLAVWVVGIFTPYFGEIMTFVLAGYLFSPVFTGKIDPSVAVRETRKAKT